MSERRPWVLPAIPWTACLVLFGLALRCYHYGRNPSMWHDEAALVVNVLQKNFGELLGPLLFSEAAPPLFLWIERVVALTLGDSTYALRLVPFLGSCLSLLFLAALARRALQPPAVPWAVLFFACSDHLLWHCCEAKPYAIDVLVATTLGLLFYATQSWCLGRRMALLAVVAPAAIFLAYPGGFLFGGLLLALLPAVWRERRWHAWLGYGLLALTVLASFALLATGPARAQRDPTIVSDWVGSFPDWDRPWRLPRWLFLSTLEVYRYCVEPLGAALTVFALVGIVRLWRRGQADGVVLLVTPAALALIASCVHAYPYGGSRVLVYSAPALVLLIAEGVPPALAWLQGRCRPAVALVVLVLVAPVGKGTWHVFSPWKRADCAGAAGFVLDHRQQADAVAANHWEYQYYFRHLGETFRPLPTQVRDNEARLWIVLTEAEAGERPQLARKFAPPGWEMVTRREFERTGVFLFQAPLSPPPE